MVPGLLRPVYDVDGRIAKIIKFASDISDLMHLGAGLARLAGNDVSRGIETPFSPTFERLRLDFNTAMANLGSTLGEVVGSAAAVDSGASEIAVASGDLSRRTEQQAASLEETAAALEQVTKTVKQTSQSAKRAHHVVSEARGDAQTSGQIVGRTVEAMGRIETSSGQINQIISVIDEIAFQTNLLALNAGVEAARAGEAGRGFAVVASEVRALAQRSADAAKQIKGLISSSAGEVEAGVKLVRDAGDSLARIVAKVMEINEEVAGIAAGAEEQARALDSVNMAVAEMDQATQQNAAMAEQANAATTAMLNECRKLSQSADRFTLSGEPAKAPPFLASRPVGLAPTRRPEPAARRA
jgi:methyl-accepting chemotaxis protein